MQRVRDFIGGDVPEEIDGSGVTIAVLDTGDCVIVLPDWKIPENKRVFGDFVLRKNAGYGVILAWGRARSEDENKNRHYFDTLPRGYSG